MKKKISDQRLSAINGRKVSSCRFLQTLFITIHPVANSVPALLRIRNGSGRMDALKIPESESNCHGIGPAILRLFLWKLCMNPVQADSKI